MLSSSVLESIPFSGWLKILRGYRYEWVEFMHMCLCITSSSPFYFVKENQQCLCVCMSTYVCENVCASVYVSLCARICTCVCRWIACILTLKPEEVVGCSSLSSSTYYFRLGFFLGPETCLSLATLEASNFPGLIPCNWVNRCVYNIQHFI